LVDPTVHGVKIAPLFDAVVRVPRHVFSKEKIEKLDILEWRKATRT
jgi:hypothetical protein